MWGYASTDRRSRRAAGRAALAALAVFSGILAQTAPASATHENRTLQLKPELNRNLGGAMHSFRATIDPAAETGGVAVDLEIVAGPNARRDGNAADTPQSPDLGCTIPSGASSCKISYRGRNRRGTDRVIAWIDHDEDNSTAEADLTEEPDAGGRPDEPGCPETECGPADTSGAGATAEPDSTDVVLALWGQMKARNAAIEDGPINFQTRGCDSAKDRNKRGRVIATARACTFIYTVPPGDDLSDQRNFGSLWIQSEVNARSNWCVEKVRMEIAIPDGARLEGVTPSRRVTNSKRKLTRVNLRIGDTTQMETVGVLKHLLYLYPGEMFKIARDGGNRQILIWKGNTRKPQAFALGLSISWLESDGLPDFASSGGSLKRFIEKKERCTRGTGGATVG